MLSCISVLFQSSWYGHIQLFHVQEGGHNEYIFYLKVSNKNLSNNCQIKHVSQNTSRQTYKVQPKSIARKIQALCAMQNCWYGAIKPGGIESTKSGQYVARKREAMILRTTCQLCWWTWTTNLWLLANTITDSTAESKHLDVPDLALLFPGLVVALMSDLCVFTTRSTSTLTSGGIIEGNDRCQWWAVIHSMSCEFWYVWSSTQHLTICLATTYHLCDISYVNSTRFWRRAKLIRILSFRGFFIQLQQVDSRAYSQPHADILYPKEWPWAASLWGK